METKIANERVQIEENTWHKICNARLEKELDGIVQIVVDKKVGELNKLVGALVSKGKSLITRTRALDQRLLGKVPEVELGEITRMETVIKNVREEIKGGDQ